MHDDTNQPDPFVASKRELSRAVDAIKADILAAGEPRPKWTQDEAIAYECARECITHMMAICTGELHNDAPTEARRAELEAERARLAAELCGLHVHDHADIARIRQDYGQRIRAHMEPPPNDAKSWNERVMRNMRRMAVDEDYRQEIAKDLS